MVHLIILGTGRAGEAGNRSALGGCSPRSCRRRIWRRTFAGALFTTGVLGMLSRHHRHRRRTTIRMAQRIRPRALEGSQGLATGDRAKADHSTGHWSVDIDLPADERSAARPS